MRNKQETNALHDSSNFKRGIVLTFNPNNNRSEQIKKFTEIIQASSSPVIVDLTRSNISDDEMKILVKAISVMKGSINLNLHCNTTISTTALCCLASVMGKITDLTLTGIQLSDQAAQAIATALAQKESRITLNFAPLLTTQKGINYFIGAVLQNHLVHIPGRPFQRIFEAKIASLKPDEESLAAMLSLANERTLPESAPLPNVIHGMIAAMLAGPLFAHGIFRPNIEIITDSHDTSLSPR